jgi:hypothetical protein
MASLLFVPEDSWMTHHSEAEQSGHMAASPPTVRSNPVPD